MSPEPYVSDIDPEASQPTSVPVDLTATQSSEDMEASCLAEIDSLEAYLEHHLNDPGSEEEEEHIYEEIEVVSQGQTACFMTQWWIHFQTAPFGPLKKCLIMLYEGGFKFKVY